jgi:glycosyltransferase involved in cell wall biosynthesis
MNKPFVTVIIPTYKDWCRLGLCIEALMMQSYGIENFEIIVVNNDSLDRTDFIHDKVILISEIKPGSYAARNAALKIAKGDYVAFTDSDCKPERDWLTNSIKVIESGVTSRVAGKVELFYENDPLTYSDIFEKAFAFNQRKYVDDGFSVTANLITTKSIFDRVGLFNESLMSGGDAEWNKRATELGVSLKYCDECIVYHPSRGDINEIRVKLMRVFTGRVKSNQVGMLDYIKLLLPPVNIIKELIGNNGLTFKERIIAFSMRYYSKLYIIYKIVVG